MTYSNPKMRSDEPGFHLQQFILSNVKFDKGGQYQSELKKIPSRLTGEVCSLVLHGIALGHAALIATRRGACWISRLPRRVVETPALRGSSLLALRSRRLGGELAAALRTRSGAVIFGARALHILREDWRRAECQENTKRYDGFPHVVVLLLRGRQRA
jgi:hypothetical protein